MGKKRESIMSGRKRVTRRVPMWSVNSRLEGSWAWMLHLCLSSLEPYALDQTSRALGRFHSRRAAVCVGVFEALHTVSIRWEGPFLVWGDYQSNPALPCLFQREFCLSAQNLSPSFVCWSSQSVERNRFCWGLLLKAVMFVSFLFPVGDEPFHSFSN